MKQTKLFSGLLCIIMLSATGCAKSEAPNQTSAAVQTQSAAEAPSLTEAPAAEETAEASFIAPTENTEKQMTGILDTKKDFMIILISDKDEEAYVFSVSDTALIKDVTPGDKVVITYTGEASIDSDNAEIVSAKKL